MFLEAPDKNTIKGHIYLDNLVTGSVYVIKYRFSRKSLKLGFPLHLGAGIAIQWGVRVYIGTWALGTTLIRTWDHGNRGNR